jgi:hypothetical protein
MDAIKRPRFTHPSPISPCEADLAPWYLAYQHHQRHMFMSPHMQTPMLLQQQQHPLLPASMRQQVLQSTINAPIETRKCRRCTCPNCVRPSTSTSTSADGERKRRMHICHFTACGKSYGKTSHLKAHLRYFSYIHNTFCNCI